MEDISSNLLIPLHNSETLPTLKKIEGGILEISDAVCKMQASISNLKRLRDKYIISLKQYETDYDTLFRIYQSMKEKLSSQPTLNNSSEINSSMMLNDYHPADQIPDVTNQTSLPINQTISPTLFNREINNNNVDNQQINHIQPIQHYNRVSKKYPNRDLPNEHNMNLLNPNLIPEPSPKSLIATTTEPAQMSIDNIPWQITTNHKANNNFNVRLRFALRTPAVLCSVQFDPQGKCVAFSDGKLLHIISSDNGALMYSLEIPKPNISNNRNDIHTRVIKFSPDGKLIAINSKSSSISIFSTETRKCIANLEGHSKTVSSLLFLKSRPNITSNIPQQPSAPNYNYNYNYNNYNGNYNNYNYSNLNSNFQLPKNTNHSCATTLISGSYDGLLCIWDLQTMRLIKVLQHGSESSGKLNHEGAIVSLATEPDESFICVGFMKGTVGIYEPTFTQPLNSFVAHNEYLQSVKTVPNESAIVTTSHDKTAKLWALHTIASCKHVFTGHKDFVICSEIAPPDIIYNNKYKNKTKYKSKNRVQNILMLTGSKDETLKGWNRETGEELFSITGHRNTLFEINHHPSEMAFVSCSGDGLICMWEYSLPTM